MHFVILTILFLLLMYGPQWWVNRVLAKYHQHNVNTQNGAQFARMLLDQQNLHQVEIIEGDANANFYDPEKRLVSLESEYYHGHSLTSLVVASHEVGHAIQDKVDYRPLKLRLQLVLLSQQAERIGSGIMLIMPLITAITRAPGVGLIMLLAGLASLGLPALVHSMTLPVEWDASFNRAIPLLQKQQLPVSQLQGAKKILRACALTYLASSCSSLLNVWRWLRILRH